MNKPLRCAAVALACLLAASAQAAEPRLRGEPASEVRTFRKEIKQVMGSAMSQQDARTVAIAQAKRDALEQAGTYLESFSVVRNASLAKDDILALSAGVLKAEIVREQPFLETGVFGIVVVAQVQVDSSVLDERIRKLLADRQGLDQLKAAEKRQQELLAKIGELEAENARLRSGGATAAQTQALQAAFKDTATRLTAQDWYEAGQALWNGNGFTPAQLAVEVFSQAIALDSAFTFAYNNRGLAYRGLKQHQRAIADYDQALRLDPNHAVAYNNRGLAYAELGQHERAISDYDRALRLDPNAAAYSNRGNAYASLKQHERAIADYDQALRLDPNAAVAYSNRGVAYAGLKQYDRAVADHDQALRLDPNYAAAYNNRGLAYADLKQHERAIADFDRALRLDSNAAAAYSNRGVAYADLKQYERAIADFDEALRLDPNYANAYKNRGKAYGLMGNVARAYQDWRRACALGDQPVCELLAKYPGP
jgi:tetratricopeptide (TPR) repeat protein